MYTTFSGSKGESAARWLHTLEHQVHGPNPNYNLEFLPPRMWLTCINGLLVGNAALWADHHPRVRQIIAANNLGSVSHKDVEIFKKAFLARFPPTRMTAGLCRPSLFSEPQIFAQDRSEDLDSYYQRALILLYEKGGVDMAEAPLTELEQEALNATILTYIEGLVDKDIHQGLESARTESQDPLGLLDIHNLAKSKTLELRLHMEQKLRDQGGTKANTGSDLTGPAAVQSRNQSTPSISFGNFGGGSVIGDPTSVFANLSESAGYFPLTQMPSLVGAPNNFSSAGDLGLQTPRVNTTSSTNHPPPTPTGALPKIANTASQISANVKNSGDNVGFNRKDDGRESEEGGKSTDSEESPGQVPIRARLPGRAHASVNLFLF
ncbi:hypothetical protein N7G274_006326 [Stereocaulon virgatum]|uniref:Uncharacterized protein n=1 Tax=Stereocaulon virgatum TaxID=373712 RepID=A0ABR4ABY8_9LECA